jgi:hemerythrin-like domain-containing protein
MPNAIELLKKDHQNVKGMLEDLLNPDNSQSQREKLLKTIEKELKVHTQIEEEIFYPAFADQKSSADKKKLYHEAKEEHRAVEKMVMPDLKDTDTGGAEFLGRAKVLKELVEHHADEEEDEMFKMATESMSEDELKKLGEKMESRKKELM